MADWFSQNAPTKSSQPATGDWFSQNAPGPAVSAAPQKHTPPSDDDLIRSLGGDPEVIKKSPRYQSTVKRWGSGFPKSDPNEKRPLNDSILGDFGQGVMETLGGGHQLLVHGLNKVGIIGDEDTQYVDLFYRAMKNDFDQNVRKGESSTAARIAGSIAVPVPGGAAVKTGSALSKVGKVALQGAAGAATQPVLEGNPEDYWSEKGKQVATGAVVAPVATAAITGAGKVAGKVVNAVKGKVPQEAAELMSQAEQHKVPITYGDITRNPMAQKTEVALESVPLIGTSGLRKDQHDAARAAANAAVEKLRAKFEAIVPGGYDDIVKAAQEGDEYARQLLDKAKAAGNDPDSVLQLGIGVTNFRTRQNAEKLYNNVQELVEKNNLGEVPLDGTRDALTWALTQAKSSKIPNKKVIQLLETIQKNLTTGNGYGAIRQLRSDLGDEIRAYHAGNNAIIGEKGVGYLQRLRGAIEGDLEYFTDNAGIPEIQKAAREADAYYKAARAPFKDGMLAQAAVDTEPDQIFQRFIKAGKEDRAQKFYQALDPKARAAVNYQMVAKALNDATDASKDLFSPQKFFASLDNLSEPYGVFMKGIDKFEIDGLKNVMRHIQRAGQFAENPPTGNRWIHSGLFFGGGAAAAVDPVTTAQAAAGVAAIAGLSKFLLTTNAGKKFLLSSGKYEPGSPAMQKALDQLIATMPSGVGKATGQD
jgi:hypothetical protein